MKKFLQTLSTVLLVFLIATTLSKPLSAQMFSIDDPEPEREERIGFFTLVGLSYEPAEFTYQAEGAEELQRLDFDSSLFRFRLESPGLEISLGFGGSLTGMDEHSLVNINGRLFNALPVVRSRKLLLSIPIQLTTDFMQVRRNRSDAEFLQSSLVFGSGLSFIADPGSRLRFNLRATPNYGFSFSQGNLFGGNLFRFDGKAVLFIKNVIGSRAISLGYHFDFRQYRIEENLNDYDYISHSFTVGVGF